MDDEIREIRRLQAERAKGDGRLASFNSITFDTNFYSGDLDKESLESSIEVGGEEEEEDILSKRMKEIDRDGKKSFLQSFTAPQQFIEDTRSKEDFFDPFKDKKRKTVADREDEYRARWRKRKLSPPQIDPFTGKTVGKQTESESRTYKEIMQDTLLEKERHEVLMKIKKKKQEEQDEIQRDRIRNGGTKRQTQWDVEEEGGEPRSRHESEWKLEIYKGTNKVNTIHLNSDITYNCGRDQGNEIVMDHGSISKKHAKITFISGYPHLMDLGSTNGTKLNGEDITSGTQYKLSDRDKIVFGCSTRVYQVSFKLEKDFFYLGFSL